MKKYRIKKIVSDYNGNLGVGEIEAEIYEYKGLQFGLYWTNEYGKTIRAIELQTGCSIGQVKCEGTKTPKQDLLRLIAHFVDQTDYESAISHERNSRAFQRRKIDAQIHELEQRRDSLIFPINERIEI